jgi:hypothetical protein
VIHSINHQDIGVRMPKGLSGREPRKTGSDNNDSLQSVPRSVTVRGTLIQLLVNHATGFARAFAT